jgi:hypothetical protein
MDKINIGFIGGCINNQAGINREHLYHSIALKLLANWHSEHKMTLGSYLSFDQLPDRTKNFIDKKQPAIIYLFIRPFPLMPLQKPIVKYDTAEETIGYSLHPALFTRQLKWNEELTRYQSSTDFVFVRKPSFGFRDLNLLAGVILGLHRWALKYLTHQLELVQQLCMQEKIKLKIISPPQNPESLLATLTCKWTANYLEKYCRTVMIDFININGFSLANFEQDRIHFNVHGHKKLGELIYEDIISGKCGATANIREKN